MHLFEASPSARPLLPTRRGGVRRRIRGRSVLVLVGIVLLANALAGERSMLQVSRAKHDVRALTVTISALRDENAALREQVRRLRGDPATIESLARRELGLARPGEVVVVVRGTVRSR